MPARRRVMGIQPALVIRSRPFDSLSQILRHWLALRLQPFEFRPVNRLHRRIALHHTDARRRPAKRERRIESLARHRVISSAAGVIKRKYNLRNCSAGHRLHHLSSGTNDPLALRLHSHHEAGNILKIDQRHAVSLRVLDEVRHLASRLGINNPPDPRTAFRLKEAAPIRHHGHRTSKQLSIRTQQFRRVVGLKFKIIVAIEDSLQRIFNVVRQPVIGGHQVVQPFRRFRRRRALQCRGRGRQGAKPLADQLQASGIIFRHIVRHSAGRGVHSRPAQRFRVHHLSHRSLHQVRAAQPHEAGAFHHDDHVAQRRQISAARDARPHHRRDLRHMQSAPHQRIVIEDARRAVLSWKNAILQR